MTQLDRIEAMLKILVAQARPDFDPKVFSDPREWQGDSCKDKLFSECPAPYLDQLALMYAAFRRKSEKEGTKLNNGKSKADWDHKLEKTATEWARYKRFLEITGEAEGDLSFPGAA